MIGSDRIRTEALDSCFDAFSSREPVSTHGSSPRACFARKRSSDGSDCKVLMAAIDRRYHRCFRSMRPGSGKSARPRSIGPIRLRLDGSFGFFYFGQRKTLVYIPVGRCNFRWPGLSVHRGNWTMRSLASALAAGTLLIASFSPGHAEQDTLLQQVKKNGVIRVCQAAYPPFNTKNPQTNEWEGLNVDLVNEIAAFLSVKIENIDTSFPALIPSL